MSGLVRLLFALSIELKAGRIAAVDLQRRQLDIATMALRIQGQSIELTPFERAEARYPGA